MSSTSSVTDEAVAEFICVNDLAAKWGCDPQNIYKVVKRGEIGPLVKLVGRLNYIPMTAVREHERKRVAEGLERQERVLPARGERGRFKSEEAAR